MGLDGRGRPRLSDEEKRQRGTFREDRSEEKYAGKDAAKVITGIFLPKVTDPEIPLGKVGEKKYRELATMLLDSNKLTSVTRNTCEVIGMLWEQMHDKRSAGKSVPMQMIIRYEAMVRDLRVAENAPAIANPNQKSRFEGAGFSNSRTSPFRLRSSSAA